MVTARRINPPHWLIRAFDYDPHLPAPLQRFFGFVSHWLGYRGFVLISGGSIYIFVGLVLLSRPDFDPHLRHTYLPLWFRFSMWAVMGAVAVVTGLAGGLWKALGFAALFVGPGERCLSFLWALVGVGGWYYSAWTGFYFVLTVTVLVFAAWQEPPERIGP